MGPITPTIFTIHAAAGNTGADAFTFSGNIFQDGSTSSDLTIVKEGGGEQILTGNANVADSTNTNTSGYLNIQEGTLKLAPGIQDPQVRVSPWRGRNDLGSRQLQPGDC